MKKILLTLVFALVLLSGMFSQYYIPEWWVTPPPNGQNPYRAHNVYVYGLEINGVPLYGQNLPSVPGIEIGVFDEGGTLAGAITITELSSYPLSIRCSTEGGGVPGSATIGDLLMFRVWDGSTEYFYPEMAVQFWEPPTADPTPMSELYFTTSGSTHIVMLEYNTPVASDTNTLTPPPGPAGGYAYDVVFDGTGITLEEGYVSAGGGGTMTIHAFDENSTDTYYNSVDPSDGTVPVEDFTQYGWFIDWNGSFYADASYPIVFSIDLNEVLPQGYTMDPTTVGIYRRDIHGTSYFYEVDSSYDTGTNIITFYLYDAADVPGEFILTGIMEEEPLPVELSSFTVVMNNTHSAVNLIWVTQSEENMVGYRIYRGDNNILADAEDQNTLIAATNTSQTTMYIYSDPEIVDEHEYHYWLEALEMDGTSQYYGPIAITTPGQGIHTPQIPLVTGLSSLYPNPFNPNLTISYTLDSKLPVRIDIVNLRGQVIKTLLNETKDRGMHSQIWNGMTVDGRPCSSGVYFVRMRAGSDEYFAKAILLQ